MWFRRPADKAKYADKPSKWHMSNAPIVVKAYVRGTWPDYQYEDKKVIVALCSPNGYMWDPTKVEMRDELPARGGVCGSCLGKWWNTDAE